MAHTRRTIDLRTRIVRASDLEKCGHYDYDERTACGINTRGGGAPLEFWGKPADEPVTCMTCIAEMTDAD